VLRGDDGIVLVDIRRLAAEFRGEGTRGDTAERAVAPLAMDAEGVEGGRRVVVFGEKEDMNSRQKKKDRKRSFSYSSHIRCPGNHSIITMSDPLSAVSLFHNIQAHSFPQVTSPHATDNLL